MKRNTWGKEKYKRYSFRRKGNVLLAKSYAPGNKKFKDKPDVKRNKGHGGNLKIKPPHPKLSVQFVKKKIKRKAWAVKRLINRKLNVNVTESESQVPVSASIRTWLLWPWPHGRFTYESCWGQNMLEVSQHGSPKRLLHDAVNVKHGLCWETPRCGKPAQERGMCCSQLKGAGDFF